MWVLGVNDGHDPSAALLKNGEVVVAIEEERLSRFKHGVSLRDKNRLAGTPDAFLPLRAMRACLDATGTTLDDMTAVVVANGDRWIAGRLRDDPDLRLGDPSIVVAPPPGSHHLLHALAAHHASGHAQAVALVADHSGSLFDAQGRGLDTESARRILDTEEGARTVTYQSESAFLFPSRVHRPLELFTNRHRIDRIATHGIGAMYARVAIGCGFECAATQLDESGKLMGLAGYGHRLAKDWQVGRDGHVLDFTEFQRWWDECRGRIELDDLPGAARTAQDELERAMLGLVTHLSETTDTDHLCVTGGVGLNIDANRCIEVSGRFETTSFLPYCHDGGNAIGAALWFLHPELGPRPEALRVQPRPSRLRHVHFGPTHDRNEVLAALDDPCLVVEREEQADTVETAVESLVAGDVVARFTGGSEFGPRALGHRSILAAAQTIEQRNYVNHAVKYREGFRPLAPSIQEERLTSEFTGMGSEFMVTLCELRAEREPHAAIHVDGTARAHVVRRDRDPWLWEVLERMHARTGCPALVHTSLNGPGEPIVETPAEAVRALLHQNLDLLVLDDHLVWRNEAALRYELRSERWEAELAVAATAPFWVWIADVTGLDLETVLEQAGLRLDAWGSGESLDPSADHQTLRMDRAMRHYAIHREILVPE